LLPSFAFLLHNCVMQAYKSKADLQSAVEWLAARDDRLAHAYDKHGLPPLRKRADGFDGLCRLLISQQVSTAAASAIQARFDALLPDKSPAQLLAVPDEALAACGVSRPKQRYLRGLARAIVEDGLNLTALRRAKDDRVFDTLVALTGIGPWTADCYLLFCLGRPDRFPAGDLALQQAYKMLYRRNTRPDAAELAALAQVWQPHRAAAARLLWTYYNGELGGQ
jgi:DNA-3-methyladenine glycosylase II